MRGLCPAREQLATYEDNDPRPIQQFSNKDINLLGRRPLERGDFGEECALYLDRLIVFDDYALAQGALGYLEAFALQFVPKTMPDSSFSARTFFNALPSRTTNTASAVTDSTVAPICFRSMRPENRGREISVTGAARNSPLSVGFMLYRFKSPT